MTLSTVSNGAVISHNDLDQAINVLKQPPGGQEKGKYYLGGNSYTGGVGGTTFYGSDVADGTLTTAGKCSTTTGGTETHTTSGSNGTSVTNVYYEMYSLAPGNNSGTNNFASIPNPTGHGWIYYPGAVTIPAGNWNATISGLSTLVNSGSTWTLRVSKLSGGVYTVLGSFPAVTLNTSVQTTYTLTATSMPATTFASGDGVYLDLWMFCSGTRAVGADVEESNSGTAGVANDMQVTIPSSSGIGGVVGFFARSLSSNSTPVSVSTDTADVAPTNLSTPATLHLTAGGFLINANSGSSAAVSCSAAGNYTIQY